MKVKFGTLIRKTRINKDMTLHDLSDAIGLRCSSYLSRVETKNEVPSPMIVMEIARVLSIDVVFLMNKARDTKCVQVRKNILNYYNDCYLDHKKGIENEKTR